jgi:pyruvate kinase
MSTDNQHLKQIIFKLEEVFSSAEKLTRTYAEVLDRVHPAYKYSAQNLILYLAFRQIDFDNIKNVLESYGISQLTKDERHIKSSIEAVISNIRKILYPDYDYELITKEKFNEGYNFQKINTTSLLGPEIAGRITRIMVTLPSDAAYDYDLVHDLLKANINCFRINCAHDGPDQWKMMIDNIHQAKEETGKECRICMDLSGPKFRTGLMRTGPKVIRLRPEKNDYGIVVNPIRFWIAPPDTPPEDIKVPYLPVEKSWYKLLKKGTVVQLMDARGKKRKSKIIEESFRGKWATTNDTTYIRTGTRLHIADKEKEVKITTIVGELMPLEEKILLRRGDQLIIHRKESQGAPAIINEDGTVKIPAHISCSLKEIFTDTKVGEPVLLDDGKIEGLIEEKKHDELVVRITWADDKGSTLRADKGINLPESELKLRGLTNKDREDLEFIAKYADVVDVSFVNTPEDVEEIKNTLKDINAKHLGVILKIETKQGYHNLPEILLNAMEIHPIGVMIARGDLAVEVGWQKLAEVQEEILKICSAAHIPDIWATQVLENLAKKGRPSRAEITDAAMAQRADCIMLNKGPHIIAAINMLDSIIRIMQNTMDSRKPKVKILE